MKVLTYLDCKADCNSGAPQEEIQVYHLKQNTSTVSGSSGSLPMSGRNGSASDADCRISEDCQVPDVELMELGPLLEEGGARQGVSKSVHSEVGLFQNKQQRKKLLFLCNFSSVITSLKGAAMLADEEEEDDEVGEVLTLPLQAHHAMEKMEEFVHKVKQKNQNCLLMLKQNSLRGKD